MKYGIWKVGSYCESDAKGLQDAGFSPITAAVLCSRGYTSAESAEEFLSTDNPLSDPMQKIKWELEDISLQYLDPDGYQQIIDYLKAHEASSNDFMNAIQSKITDRLASVGIHGSIYGRIKHTYSIYRKMRAQNKTIDELYDLYAFRVIVDNIADCYNVLGHIHDLFNPIPGRFKDYISTPKPNMGE